MGTRADFYVGIGETAEWLGSIAWDGYPDGEVKKLFKKMNRLQEDRGLRLANAPGEVRWRALVADFLAKRKDGTTPEMGWPWPWDDSGTTDYAYAFTPDGIVASGFGHPWFDPTQPEPEEETSNKSVVFPNMATKQRVTMGKRSGLTVIGGGPGGPRIVEED